MVRIDPNKTINIKAQKSSTKQALKPSFYQDFLGPDQVKLNIDLKVKSDNPSMFGWISDGASWIANKANEFGAAVADNISKWYKTYIAGESQKADKAADIVTAKILNGDKKGAGTTAKASIVELTVDSKVMTKEQKAEKIQTTKQMSDEEAVTALLTLQDKLKQGITNKDIKVIASCTTEYVGIIKGNPEVVKKASEVVKNVSRIVVVGIGVIAEKTKEDSKAMMLNNSNADDAKRIKEDAVYTEIAATGTNCVIETLSREEYSADIEAKGIIENAKSVSNEIKTAALSLIQVAEAKGYKLDNFAQLASIAGVGGGESAGAEVVATTDVTQVNVLNKIKQTFNTLTEDVMNMLRDNREENGRLDKAAAEKKAQSNAEEKKYIEIAMLRKEEVKKLINNIQDKKLQSKLTAEVIALSYMLKNPEEITPAQIDAMRDDVNKIKWQAIYSRS